MGRPPAVACNPERGAAWGPVHGCHPEGHWSRGPQPPPRTWSCHSRHRCAELAEVTLEGKKGKRPGTQAEKALLLQHAASCVLPGVGHAGSRTEDAAGGEEEEGG